MKQEQEERKWSSQSGEMSLKRALWVNDRYAVRCRGCDARFNFVRRRHHCRNCGQVFCSECLISSSTTFIGEIFTDVVSSIVGLQRDPLLKVCHVCDRILQERGIGRQRSWRRVPLPRKGISDKPTANKTVVKHGWEAAVGPGTATTVEVVSLGTTQRVELPPSVGEGVGVISSFSFDEGCATPLRSGVPSLSVYRPSQPRLPTHPEDPKEQEISYGLTDTPVYSRNSMTVRMNKFLKEARKLRINESPEKSQSDLSTRTYTPHPKATFRIADARSWQAQFANVFSNSILKRNLRRLESQSSYHLIRRVSRLFMKEEVLSSLGVETTGMDRTMWIAGLCDISWRIVSQLPIVLHERIEQHLDVICIADGQFVETEIITGVAFIQNVAFKRMKTYVKTPRILLLSGEVGKNPKPGTDLLEYVEGYEGHLDTQYHRIHIWRPSVIVVQGNMHHYLQDKILRQSDATLILNVGETIIRRLSRCCKANIVSDLQYVGAAELYDTSLLGTCESFELVHHGDKPVCIFKTPQVPLFTVVLLRGAEERQLTTVKRVLLSCAATAHHLALEAHCVFDLGMTCAESSPIPVNETKSKSTGSDADDDDNEEEEEDYDPPAWGESSSLSSRHCEEYMQLITRSPRVEDRLETLSMNTGVEFPSEILSFDEKYDELMMDSIIVNTVFLDCVMGNLPGEETNVGMSFGAAPNYTVRQVREVFPFYNEGDETLLEFLTERAREGDSTRLIVHGNKRIWVRTFTDFNNTDFRCPDAEQNELSFRFALAKSSALSHPRGKAEEGTHISPVIGRAVCKNCFHSMGNSLFGSPAACCSPHTLNISWGAFLELLIYSSSRFTLRCGHSLSQEACISFVVFSRTGGEVTVNIIVESLTVYDVITPPEKLPSGVDTLELYLKAEKEELLRCVQSIVGAIQAMTASQAQQQQASAVQTQPSPSNNQRIPKPPLANLLNGRGFGLGDSPEFGEDKGMLLLRRAADLLLLIPSLKTGEDLTILRLNDLANLVSDFLEWYKNGVFLAERRNGKPPTLMEITAFEDQHWAYCPRGHCGLRLNEPTSLVALTLQVSGLSPGSQRDSLLGYVRNDVRPIYETASKEIAPNDHDSIVDDNADNNEPMACAEERAQGFPEESMAIMLGIEPSLLPDIAPSSLFISSVLDALDILANRSPASKTTFKHAMDVMLPWDKNGVATVTVEVMFPEQFAALQYIYTGGRVDDMLFSLSRSRAIKPQGGKTKSEFFITLDERFLMKQIKQAELKHFAEFGPKYFSYMSHMYGKAENHGKHDATSYCSSVLCKIFGVFSIHVKREKRFLDTPAEIRYFALMENVFFSRRADITYDLKGSQRNRTAVEGSSVLLDQDLVNTLRKGAFFYCTNDVKSILMDSLTADAHLLSTSSIMDYSLIAALNEDSRQLCLGVIDYLHPYTGVKVIESKVKAGIDTVLGHAGRDPTIIDPVSYRIRFARWLEGCFCGVPDKSFAVRRAMAKENRRINK
ncbi:phosphatidylinositol (3,5) kinase [Trypanosoma cruzi Dm28c]|uniref:1-phosphatidylinositol-3-phosphate 5-kinase n=2 Tax=Trypanosoma cruzi TaxID=5693 RepID=V5B9K3_TRYCR|nr:phosphatidylinositol (3,5) kinase [Trypanosoma cruzi Dm28c]PWU85149.1 putative phosphatidylinositol (3,5) kinase [Trypanosoma cruzi]